jgi:hypothetical protein
MVDRLFTDRALQDAYRALMQAGAAAGHIDEATWDRIAANQIEPGDRDRVFDHVLECEQCARVWRGVLALHADAEAQGLIARAAPTTSWTSRLLPLAAAAVLVLAIGVMVMRQQQPGDEQVRSAAGVATLEGLMMAYAADGIPTLVWTPVPEATRYRVEVFTDDGQPVWEQEAASPPLRWPERAPRVKGAYRWRVDALNGETLVARSRLTPMELVR